MASTIGAIGLSSVPYPGMWPASLNGALLAAAASVPGAASGAFENGSRLGLGFRLPGLSAIPPRYRGTGALGVVHPAAGLSTGTDWSPPAAGVGGAAPARRVQAPGRPHDARDVEAPAVSTATPYVAPAPTLWLGSGEGGAAAAGGGGGGAGPAVALIAAVALSLMIVLSSKRLSLDLVPLQSRLASSPLERPG